MLRGITGRIIVAVTLTAGCSSNAEDGMCESGACEALAEISTPQTKLLPSVGGGNFGHSIDFQGDTAVVGAIGGRGSVYVFQRSLDGWSEQARLLASDGAEDDFFGDSVALYGKTIVVGAPYADDNGDLSGSAYVFAWDGSAWTEQAKLLPHEGTADERFGESVALSGDTAVVGTVTAGAYVFQRHGDVWTQYAKLLPDCGLDPDDLVGQAVALSGDTVLVGGILDDDRAKNAGGVYAFGRGAGKQTAKDKFIASDGSADAWFGGSLALHGTTAVIGASGDDGEAESAGAAYVFQRSGETFEEDVKLVPRDVSKDDRFGFSVSLWGNTLVVGAVADDAQGSFAGSAYVFKRRDGEWTEQTKLLAVGGEKADLFGHAIGVWGNTVLIGAPGDDATGSVTVHELRD